jgi:hypothetical protein
MMTTIEDDVMGKLKEVFSSKDIGKVEVVVALVVTTKGQQLLSVSRGISEEKMQSFCKGINALADLAFDSDPKDDLYRLLNKLRDKYEDQKEKKEKKGEKDKEGAH